MSKEIGVYDEMNNEMMKWTKKLWNEQWNDETQEGLSKSVKHTKWTSALSSYDDMTNEINKEMIKWTMKW